MIELVALNAKTYSYLIDGYNDEDYEKSKIINKKAKGTKRSIIKRELVFDNCKESLFDNKIILKSQQRFKSNYHRVYTEEVNKITPSSNDDKKLQTYDPNTTYPYGTPAIKVCELDILLNEKAKRLLYSIDQ